MRGFSIAFMLGAFAIGALALVLSGERAALLIKARGSRQHTLARRSDCRFFSLFLYRSNYLFDGSTAAIRASLAETAG